MADRDRLDRDTAWETEGSEFPDNRTKLETEVASAYSVLLTIPFYAVALISASKIA